MELLVETTDLTKRSGHRAAMDHVALHVRRGEVYGFLASVPAAKVDEFYRRAIARSSR